MKVVESSNRMFLYGDDMKAYDTIPAGTYDICFADRVGFFLSRRSDMVVSEKVYGVQSGKVEKVCNSFKNFNRNLGVILSGDKGIGKSLTAKMIAGAAIKEGYPVLLASRYIPGIADFIESVDQEVMVLFDEFDKTFKATSDNNPQDTMLSLFDGTTAGKKLFIVTCNKLNGLNDYLVNRPGRFHYHFRFDYPDSDAIQTYLHDKLDKKYYDQIQVVVDFAAKIDLNYDCLRAISFELNLGTPFAEAIKDLNIINLNETDYKLTVVFANGNRASTTRRIDLFGEDRQVYFDVYVKSIGYIDCGFGTEDLKYNPANGEQYADGKCVRVENPYDKDDKDEKDKYDSFENNYKVDKLIVSRSRKKDIHYAV